MLAMVSVPAKVTIKCLAIIVTPGLQPGFSEGELQGRSQDFQKGGYMDV